MISFNFKNVHLEDEYILYENTVNNIKIILKKYEDYITLEFETVNLINIDNDLFECKKNKSEIVNKLLKIWKSDPVNNLKTLLKKIENEVIELESSDHTNRL